MVGEIIIAVVSAVISSVVTWIFTRRQEARTERRQNAIVQREIFENRPEMSIVEYKDYLSRPGYGIKQKCDIELFVAQIDRVTVENNGKKGRKKKEWVIAHFNTEDKNTDQWACVIYTFRNVGKTDISATDVISRYQKETCIFPCELAGEYMVQGVLNYSCCHDRKIRVGETVSVKLCYHKERVTTGMFSANMSIGMQDDHGRYWQQPLFAPTDKVYDSRQVRGDRYMDDLRPDTAIECFKNLGLW